VNRNDGPLAIAAEGVRFAYPDGIEALAECSFRAREGDVVAVMGANGSGKTTLLKVLMRLLRPQCGTVRVGEVDVARLSAAQLYRRVGMVFQNPADQLFGASVEQDVAFGPRNLGLAESEVRDRVEESLAAVEVLPLRDRPIHHLSFGQQKRVCLAGVLAMQPSILLLDEPTVGLDPVGETHMIDLLVRLNRRRRATLIVSTHGVDLLPILADRVCVLSAGRVWREGTPREVFALPEPLAEVGLRIPLVAQLFHMLQKRGAPAPETVPLTVAEAGEQILRWLDGGGAGRAPEGGAP
jgi:cobalt/nickel transport system ATP-binding protein